MFTGRIERANSRYLMVSYGVGACSSPVYQIVRTADSRAIHSGKRKHIVELWNTRYNLARPRAFAAS